MAGEVLLLLHRTQSSSLRAKLAKEAWDWQWSSARYHIGRKKRSLVTEGNLFDYISATQKQWRDYLKLGDDEKSINESRKCTKTDLPLEAERFIQKLEAKIGRALRVVPKGRPWHKKSALLIRKSPFATHT